MTEKTQFMKTNLPYTADLHRDGAYAVRRGDGTLALDCAENTGYSARANFRNSVNRPWSKLVEEGCRVVRLLPVAIVEASREPSLHEGPEIDITTFAPQGSVFGAGHCTLPAAPGKKVKTFAKVQLLTDSPSKIYAKLPASMTADEAEACALALLEFADRVRLADAAQKPATA